MSRHTGMSSNARRNWAIGLVIFFVLMCGGIAVSEWYAYSHNVPYYEHRLQTQPHSS